MSFRVVRSGSLVCPVLFQCIAKVALASLAPGFMPHHSWEHGDANAPVQMPQSGSHSWEEESEGSNSEFDDVRPPSAGQQLVDHATHLYLMRSLSAADFCVLMHWSNAAGVKEAERYAYKPGAPTGHYQRHLNSVFPFLQDQSGLYQMSVPCYNKDDFGRSTHMLHALPPHEVIEKSMSSDPTLRSSFGRTCCLEGAFPCLLFESGHSR